jgi:hypothetical protein
MKPLGVNGQFRGLRKRAIFEKSGFMIRIFPHTVKDKISIIAVADHQRDLNNLRFMSYRLLDADKVHLNKDEFGGPYLKFDCEEFKKGESYDEEAIQNQIREWQSRYE